MIDGNDPVLCAYYLARTFRVHPDQFLNLTPEEIERHMVETERMTRVVANARSG